MCAIEAGKRGRKTLLLEHSANIAEKIRISGGGRCNFTNLTITPQHYISNNPHFCVSALKRYTQQDFISLIKKHNISFHEKTLGQLFCDDSSQQIINMLLAECVAAHVEIKTNSKITNIAKNENFTVTVGLETYQSASLVVACGGLSIPKIGATGFGYEIAHQFGLNIIPTRAGLVPLAFAEHLLAETKDLIGVSFNGAASCNKKTFSEGIIFTHRGISGPAILQISSYWQPGDEVELNLAGDINALEKLKELKTANPKQELKTALANIMPRKLAAFVCNNSSKKMADHSNAKLAEITTKITNWPLKPISTEGYRTAEVTLGGVDTEELSSKTFESKKHPGLFFIGEVVDVTGWLGGYNFQWAWSSGHAAGQYV
ncbi:MAG: NAD(P)/FAD-dependent oxidoreductase [Rickettsiales bacterium]|jgi:predicted Rossmann fold flavoprotein|nr:NAD(P)/FAD-dependent oxidoreductase [Rickettsiales bacterium]